MSEYDEEQPPPPWRPTAPRNPWGAAAAPTPRASEPAAPWTSPGFGRPFPGEPTWGDHESPAEPAFSYPYPGYEGPPAYTEPLEYAAPSPYSRPPTYPGATDASAWQGGWPGSTEPGWPPPAGPGWPPPAGPGWPPPASPGWSPEPPGPPGYGSWGPQPAPGWAPLPPGPPPSRTNPLTVILIAVLIAAVIGLGIGGQLVTRHTTIRRVPNFFPSPTPGSVPTGGVGLPATQAATIAAAVDPSVVDINTKLGYQRAAAAGTGMVLTSDGQVLTNNHVVAGATSLMGAVVGGKSYTAKVLGTDPTDDIALIKLEGASGLMPIRTGDPAKLATGDAIVAVGNAGGLGGTPSVVTGTVVALDQSVTASDIGGGNAEQLSGLIEINAPLQPGDSGGPLITADGLVVGMNTAASASNRVESQSSVGFAIPISKAIAIGKEIAAGHASATIQIGVPGFLGVNVPRTQTAGISGAVISGVLPASPAEKAGLATGDVITSINGQPVVSPSTLTAILRQRHPGDKVTVAWADTAGKSHTATIALTVGPAA